MLPLKIKYFAIFKQSRFLLFIILFVLNIIYFLFTEQEYLFIQKNYVLSLKKNRGFYAKCSTQRPSTICAKTRKLINGNATLDDIDKLALIEIRKLNCSLSSERSNTEVLFILPYRNRTKDLLAFLLYMTPFLHDQKREVDILVIEQEGKQPFNRAKLFNIAIREIDRVNGIFNESRKNDRLTGISCFALHDVDKLPINPDMPYYCGKNPPQLVRYIHHSKGHFA